MRHTRWGRARAAMGAAFLAVSPLVALQAATVTPLGAVGSITLTESAPSSILYGTTAGITLTAANPSGNPPQYNLSLRDVLPAGVSYVSGSTTPALLGDPTVLANAPSAGQTTLIWSNVADLQPGSSYSVGFQLKPVTGAQAATDNLLPGNTFSDSASAYVNSDPRFVPHFDPVTGVPVGSSYTGTASAAPPSILISPIGVTKNVPAPNGQFLRGVHDQARVYTLTVKNNLINPTDSVVVDDWLPAALEFLGCGGVDQTTNAIGTNPGFTNEYPGAPPLGQGLSSPPNCLTPTLVSTEDDTPPGQPNGVYTHLQWTVGSLAPGATATIEFYAGIPMRANSLSWAGSTPNTTGGQTANLDNNQGSETTQGETITNTAQASGDYQGPLGGGATNPVSSVGTNTTEAADLAIEKSVNPTGFLAGQQVTYSLDFQTGEYRYAGTSGQGAVITDIVPNGVCPIDNLANYDEHSDPQCAPVGPGPTLTDNLTSTTTPLPYSSVAENPDGTFTVTWDLSPLPPNSNETIHFAAVDRSFYQSDGADTTPTLAGDTYVNSATFSAGTDATCVLGGNADPVPDPLCTSGGAPIYSGETAAETGVANATNASSAAQDTEEPTVAKRIALPPPSGQPVDCSTATYISTDTNPPPAYQKGDEVCFQLEVDFPPGVQTKNPVVTDFLPPNSTYVNGSAVVLPGNTVTQSLDTSNAGNGVLVWTLGDLNADGNYYAGPGQVFLVDLAVTPTADPSQGNSFDLTGNLMKFTAENTAGQSISERDQAEYDLSWPLLSLVKGVEQVVRGVTTVAGPFGFGSNVDNVQVEDGDQVTFRVDLTNTGLEPAQNVQVEDNLPPQVQCATDVTAISNGGACNGSSQIVWPSSAGISVPAATGPSTPGELSLTYVVTIPNTVAAGESLPDHAGVASYQGTNDEGGTNTYIPANNIDPSNPPSSWNTQAADDTSAVETAGATLTKTAAPQVTPQGSGGPQATIGEPILYTLTATVPAGTNLYNATLSDPLGSLPGASLAEIPGSATATLNGSPVPGTFTLSESNNTVTLQFPATFNAPVGSPQTVVVTFLATVTNIAGNVAGANLTNTGTLAFQDSQSNPENVNASATVGIIEPDIVMTKTDPNSGSGTPYAPGSTVPYTLTVSDAAGAATAYGLTVTDVLPVGVVPVGGTISNGGTALFSGGQWTITWDLGTGFTIAPGGSQQLTYSATLPSQPIGSTSFVNNATADVASLDTSLYPGARTAGPGYSATAQDVTHVVGTTITKSANPTSVIVGQDTTYTATVTIPANLSFPTLTAIDNLPDGMVFDSYGTATCQLAGGGSCGSDIVDTPLETPTLNPGTGQTELAWFIGDVQPAAVARTVTLTYSAYPATHYTVKNGGGPVKPGDVLHNMVGTSWSDTVGCEPSGLPISCTYTHTSAQAVAPVTVVAPTLSVQKVSSNPSPTPGVPFTYTVTVTNTSALPAYDATVNDPINGLLQVPTNIVASQGSAVYNGGTQKIVWNLSGLLAAGNSATLTYQEELGPSGSITNNKVIPNTATVASFYGVPIATVNANPGRYDTYGPVSGSTSVTAVFPSLAVTKSTPSGSTATMGSPFTWQYVVSDSTVAPLSATSAVDTLPAFWTYDTGSTTITPATGPPITGAAADPTVNTVGNTQTLTWSSLGGLANGQTITVTYQATPNPGAVFGTSPNVNAVTVSGQDATGASGNASGPYVASANASAFINAADLAITKTVATSGGLVAGAANDAYNLAVVNNGPSAAQGPITVTDSAPPDTSFTGASGLGWQCSLGSGGGSVTCTLPGPLASGAPAPALTVSIDIPSSYGLPSLSNPSITNSATVSGPTYDPNMGNNTSTITSPVTLQADLSITKTHTGSFTAGSTGVYQLTVTNNGPSDEPMQGGGFSPVTVVDTLPAGMTYVSATTSPNWTCGASGQTVTCQRTGAGMPAGHSSLISLNVAVASNVANNTTLTNTATVTGNIPDPNLSNNSASDPTNIVTSADLSIVKTHDPSDTFVPGTDVTYTLAVANAGPSDAVTPTVSDTLPSVAGVPTETFVSASGSGWTCGAVGQVVTCNATANLPADTAASPITLIVQVAPGFTGSSIDNTATVGSTTSDPNLNNNSFTDSSNAGSASADLSIVKSHTGDFTAGDQGTYTLQVANAGPSDAAGPVTVTDDLPAGMSFVSGTGSGWSCGAVGQTVTCTLAAGLAANGGTSISLVVNVASSTPEGVLTNTASVQSPTPDPNQLNNSSSDQTTIQTSADLGITKTHTGAFTPGTQGTYTLVVTNYGHSDAAGPVTVTDELPAAESFVSGSSSDPWGCAAVGQLVTCTLAGGLAANATTTIDLTVAIDPGYVGGPIVNTATVSSPTTDPNPANDSDTDTTGAITPEADLSITKTHTGNFTAGSPASYTLAVTNNGPSDNAGPITVSDTLPSGETYVSASGSGWTCNPAPAATVTCTQATGLPTGTNAAPITLNVTIDPTFPPNYITNIATVSSGSTNDPNPNNNSSTDVALVGALADLAITKKGNGDFIPGQNGTYTINVTNNGPSTAAGPIVVADTLPTGLSYVSAGGTGWACSYDAPTNTVTCDQAAPLLNGASSQPITLTVGVAAAAYPTVTNTASVSSSTVDPDSANNTSAYTSTVEALDDMTLTKTHVGNPVAGQDLTYQLAVSNQGPTPDPGPVKVVDQLPSSLTYVSAMGPGWQCSASGQTVTCIWSVPFPVGVTSTISLIVLPGADAVPSVTNTATVTGAANDHTPSNNSSSDTATTAPGAKLTLTKQLETPELVTGGSATYIITLANAGPSPATDLVITDDVPSGLEPTSASGTGWQCTIAGQTVTCDNPGPLAAGSSSQVTLVAKVTASGGTITNGATVASTTSILTGSSTTASTPPVGVNTTSGGSGGSSSSSGTSGGTLAFTGFALWPTLSVGVGLLGGGALLLLLGRRRRPARA